MILNTGSGYASGDRESGSPVFLFKDRFIECEFGLVQLLDRDIIADSHRSVIEVGERHAWLQGLLGTGQ